MTERISVRGLGCRPNGGWMSADIRYRSAGMAGAITARGPDHELEERQSAAPATDLDRFEHDPGSLRARHANGRSPSAHRDRRLPRANGDSSTGCRGVLCTPLPTAEPFQHANERKFSNTEPASILDRTLQQVPAEPNWPRFVSFVIDLIGVENLVPNPSPDGGGQRRVNADVTRCVEKITPDTNPEQSAGKVLAFWDRYFQRRQGSP